MALNDSNADADRNLARILIHDGNFSRAEELLKKSLVVEPLNPVTLTLMCVAEIQTGDDDGALATARKVHQLPHEGYSVVHYVAGQALEHKGQPQDAYTEYETYLRESPNGAEAGQVRNALTGSRPAAGPIRSKTCAAARAAVCDSAWLSETGQFGARPIPAVS